MTALLELTNISRDFGGVRAVDGVSFSLEPGCRTALIGPNGAGKTSLMNILSGLIRADQGQIRLNGKRIDRLTADRRAHHGIGRTFQITNVYKRLSVRDNLAISLAARNPGDTFRWWRGWSRNTAQEALVWAERLGLATLADKPAGLLAYGDQKRLDIGLALIGRPRLLLLDEPMAGVTQQDRESLMTLATDLLAEGAEQAGILFTEHDMNTVFQQADRILVLDHGRLIADGTPDQIARDASVQRLYLGQKHPANNRAPHQLPHRAQTRADGDRP